MSNIYNILGKLKAITASAPTTPEVEAQPIYESVAPKGDIMEAVRSLESKFATFKEATKSKPDFLDVDKDGNKKEPFKKAVKDKKQVEEAAKPDFLDVDKDGDKKEPFKKAVKDKKKVEEGAGPYELHNPKHPKFKANYDKYKAKHPDCTIAEYVAAMKKKEKGLAEGKYDEPEAPNAEAIAKRKRLQAIKDRQEEQGDDYSDRKSHVRTVAGKAYGGAAQKDDADDLDEVAPPGAKAERMVKHIKKGYAGDGKLTKKEKGIAYATAWKAHNKGQVEEGTEFKDSGKIKNSAPNMKKAKLAIVKEGRVMEETDYFYEKIGKALAEKNPHLNTATGDFVTAVRKEMVAQGMEPNRARNILMMDEDFISDVASSYDHYSKELAEAFVDTAQSNIPAPTNAMPVTAPVAELDEIARLAGLSQKPVNETHGLLVNGKEVNVDSIEVDGVNSWDSPDFADAYITYAEFSDGTPMSDMELDQLTDEHGDLVNQAAHNSLQGANDFVDEEIEMDEGNEFTKARLDAIAQGKDAFQVGGKMYKVTEDINEDINVSVNTNGEFDSINLIRQLAGLNTYAHTMGLVDTADNAPELDVVPQDAEEVAEERDIEYVNTPNEKIASVSASIPSGTDLHKSKRQDPQTANKAANPLAEKGLEESLWSSYESMINDVKK